MENVGPDGNLNTDKVVRALLAQRNNPDPVSRLSPAQVLFGRQLRDTMPCIDKSTVCFVNPQVSGQWRELWRLKEETMRQKYSGTLVSLAEHSRQLRVLQLGDNVFVQNQTGSSPTRWDRTGTVMEVKPDEQYLIKILGTERVTLRNRRFLRKIKECNAALPPTVHQRRLESTSNPSDSAKVCTETYLATQSASDVLPSFGQSPHFTSQTITGPATTAPCEGATSSRDGSTTATFEEVIPPAFDEPSTSSRDGSTTATFVEVVPLALDEPSRIAHGEDSKINVSPSPQPSRRSTRIRKRRLFYDPLTGGYTEQNPP